MGRLATLMQNLAQHVGHLGWNIVLELDLEQHLIVAWHLSSRGLLELRHQDTREAWVREPSNGGNVSGGPNAGEALDVVMSQRAGKMGNQGVNHSFFGRRGRVLVLIQRRLAGMRVPSNSGISCGSIGIPRSWLKKRFCTPTKTTLLSASCCHESWLVLTREGVCACGPSSLPNMKEASTSPNAV